MTPSPPVGSAEKAAQSPWNRALYPIRSEHIYRVPNEVPPRR